MSSQGSNIPNHVDRISQLEAENKALQAQLAQIQASHQATIKRLEQRLTSDQEYQESQLRFRTIFEQSPLGNKIIAADLRILQVNKALETMLGYPKAQLEGSRIIDYVLADHEKPWRELQERLWKEQIPAFSIETVLVKKDGSLLWCSVTSILITDGEETLGYTILEDISVRKTLEAKLQKMYETQETTMHVVAHDLKSPIHNIKSLSSLLNKELAAAPPGRASAQSLQYNTMIGEACDKAYKVLEDLLVIGEIESSKTSPPKTPTDLKTLIESQVRLFTGTAQQKGVSLRVELPPEPVPVALYPEKFARVLENLLSNAIKFTRDTGQVIVSLKSVAGLQKVILQVQDNGIGIPDSLQAIIFDKFTKANRQGTQGESTTGLGLYIVKQIVELHQGKVWLASKEHQGTTFFIELRLESGA